MPIIVQNLQKSLEWILIKKYTRFWVEYGIKMSLVETKKFYSPLSPLITNSTLSQNKNWKEILTASSKNRLYNFLGPIWVWNAPFKARRGFLNIFIIVIYVYTQLFRKISWKTLVWILEGFGTNLGVKMPYLPYHRVNFKKSLGQFQIQSKQAFWAQNGVKITYLRPQGISSKKQLCTESFPNVFNLKYWAATLFSKHHYIPTVEKSMRKVVDRQTYKHTCRLRQHNNKLKTLKSVNLKQ